MKININNMDSYISIQLYELNKISFISGDFSDDQYNIFIYINHAVGSRPKTVEKYKIVFIRDRCRFMLLSEFFLDSYNYKNYNLVKENRSNCLIAFNKTSNSSDKLLLDKFIKSQTSDKDSRIADLEKMINEADKHLDKALYDGNFKKAIWNSRTVLKTFNENGEPWSEK